ncbi:MAG: hypothetical protein V1775_07220 [Bacteroidota bacterium]
MGKSMVTEPRKDDRSAPVEQYSEFIAGNFRKSLLKEFKPCNTITGSGYTGTLVCFELCSWIGNRLMEWAPMLV